MYNMHSWQYTNTREQMKDEKNDKQESEALSQLWGAKEGVEGVG